MDNARLPQIDQHLATLKECIREIDDQSIEPSVARMRTGAALDAISHVLRLITRD